MSDEATPLRGLAGRELVARWRGGDESAADELYRRYCVDLLRLVALHMSEKVAARFDPEDVVQSAFRTLFRRTAGGEFSFDGDAGVWRLLVKISLNKLRKRIRSLKTQKNDLDRECAVDEEMLVRLSGAPSPREALVFAELLERVLQSLPEDERRAIQLRLEGYSQQEIAEKLGVTDRTVRRMWKRIQESVEGLFEDAPGVG